MHNVSSTIVRTRSMQLCFAPRGTTLILKDVLGGHEVRHRLAEMGMVSGTELELLQASGSGPVMVRIGGSKIGIGRGMAQRIEVSVKEE
ncbi:MAG TPA: FeoA family protein [Spirochaetota bacterium]|nr:FeoA family protein [Spirochaetota bacterium]